MVKKNEDKEQSKRFIEKAKELGADDSEAFELAFMRLVPPKPERAKVQQSLPSVHDKIE